MSTTTTLIPSRPAAVSQAELRALLTEAIRKATPLTLVALTKPEQKITPFGVVRKLQRVNAMGGCKYFAAAERKGLEAQDERSWGDRSAAALVTRTRKDGTLAYYLPVQLNHVSRPLYLVAGPSGSGKLAAIPADRVRQYLRPERPNVIAEYRDFALSNILSIHIAGKRIRVQPEPVIV